MSLTLTLRQPPPGRISLAGILPQRLAGLSLAEIERLPLRWGGQTPALGEFFRASGAPGPRLAFEGMDARFADVARGMAAGECDIEGDAGDFVAAELSGGRVTVRGSVGRLAASGMRGGLLHVRGDAGERLGAALPWLAAGMQGGRVVVEGRAGARCGERLRRGEILVGGDAGDFCGALMVAGTLAVGGRLGAHAGYAMRRGSLLLFGAEPAPAPGFVETVCAAESFLALLHASWHKETVPEALAARLDAATAWRGRRWLGDLASDGRGEIIRLL
ncbi:MAG TPA: formylmethanofuran dehydrogenase subunit C [Candidatus Desulfobacillus sp.]|nr:formylmethanofuran dehydrogenase subunit C [Candidatus Desulfobacillus sp.]